MPHCIEIQSISILSFKAGIMLLFDDSICKDMICLDVNVNTYIGLGRWSRKHLETTNRKTIRPFLEYSPGVNVSIAGMQCEADEDMQYGIEDVC